VGLVWGPCGWDAEHAGDRLDGMTTTTSRSPRTPSDIASTTRYSTQACGLLLAAFAGSAAYTVYTTVAGLPADGFSAKDPAAWAYYLIGFTAALYVRTDRRAAWRVLAVLLPVLLAVSVFVYPSSFVPALQTPLGWLENDGYVALLAVALYLTVQRPAGRRSASDRRGPRRSRIPRGARPMPPDG
jgi:hypothetical protein